jgi:hypothetical protein
MEFGSTVALLFANSAVQTAGSALPDADIVNALQLAVAPVFLLSAVGAILAVLSRRRGGRRSRSSCIQLPL